MLQHAHQLWPFFTALLEVFSAATKCSNYNLAQKKERERVNKTPVI